MIRIKFVEYMRGRNVFLITNGRKYGGRQSYPFLVSTFSDEGTGNAVSFGLFSYPSATGMAIAKDLERPLRELALIGANTRAITTDNCANLLKALKCLSEQLRQEFQSQTGPGVIHNRCVDHSALLALDDVIREDCRAAEWLAALKTFGAFIWRRPVAEALSALEMTCKKPHFLDAKWVANLELSSFLTTFRWEIEEVRCSIGGLFLPNGIMCSMR
jgi:hypothetical protein